MFFDFAYSRENGTKEKTVRVEQTPFVRNKATKNALLSTDKGVFFLNDVCLWQMMLALPMMTAAPNDVCLTAHWANIISPQAMHHLTSTKTYDIIIEKEVQ